MALQKDETYLFGFSSPSIRRRRGDLHCFGVYATDRRIFFVQAPLRMQIMYFTALLIAIIFLVSAVVVYIPLWVAGNIYFPTGFYILESLGFVFLFGGIASAWYKDFSQIPIQELERKSAYMIERAEISRIEMKDRGFFLNSWIVTVSRSGERRTTMFTENGSFKQARHLFQAFAPELCLDL